MLQIVDCISVDICNHKKWQILPLNQLFVITILKQLPKCFIKNVIAKNEFDFPNPL